MNNPNNNALPMDNVGSINYITMTARIYDAQTGIMLFEATIHENEKGNFERFLEAQGFVYINHRQCYVNKERGHECVMWD